MSCQRMSLLPSALKSPTPATDQIVGTLVICTSERLNPFMNQIFRLPEVSCQRMSPLPSPLKSPVPATLQIVGSLPMTDDCETATLLPEMPISQIHTSPAVSRQSRSG